MKHTVQPKKVVIHMGPHKTGTTYIQDVLKKSVSQLRDSGVDFIHDTETHRASLDIASQNYDIALDRLKKTSEQVSNSEYDTFIISQEDFSGGLPGRSKRGKVYPRLTKNMRVIAEAMKPHTVEFLFFIRPEQDWLRSCYNQNIRYRTDYSKFEDFMSTDLRDHSWEDCLSRARKVFGGQLLTFEYSHNLQDGTRKILGRCGIQDFDFRSHQAPINTSPSRDVLRKLERINEVSSFKETAWFAKRLVSSNWSPKTSFATLPPPRFSSDHLASVAFPHLTNRVRARLQKQSVPNILPEATADFEEMFFRTLPSDVVMPDVTRSCIQNQSMILDYHFRGKSLLSKNLALCISYLRRDTNMSDDAKNIFHTILEKAGILLLNELSTRWLISVLQTFFDHGISEGQRIIGAGGYFYANLMKLYEGERALEGLDPWSIYASSTPAVESKFRGLDRFNLGGTDLNLNTNALLLEMSALDDTAGMFLVELLLRVQCSANVFTRLDRNRKAKQIVIDGFEDTWSFFINPSMPHK